MPIEKIKSSLFYKLMKTTEAVLMVALPTVFVILGWFALYPTIALVAAYIALNLTGYNDKALWQTRDRVVDSTEDLKETIKKLETKIDELKSKL